MLKIFKALFPTSLKSKVKDHLGVPSLSWTLINLKKIGYEPQLVLDIGAYEGYWTKDFLSIFPTANILMLEAQEKKRNKLKGITNQFHNTKFYIALLSDEDGKQLIFQENETASHVSSEVMSNVKSISSRTIDSIIIETRSGFPDFIKLDVQGHELQVLNGSEKALENCTFCLIEVTLIKLSHEPYVLDIMKYMDMKGFQLYDISQFMRRPFDNALYQCDFLFVKKDSSFISQKRWN